MNKKIYLVYGPTASGKSARAVELALAHHGVIINADATQLYADLQILSARPTEAELSRAPHRLYGILRGDAPATAASWLARATAEIKIAWEEGKLPILCGGTGLYLKALQEGLSPMPEVPAEVRLAAQHVTNEEIGSYLRRVDPVTAERLKQGDTQRLRRAYEVHQASGKPLSYWQAQPRQIIFPEAEFIKYILNPPREVLYERCDRRFLAMVEQGAIAEVQALLAKDYPAMAPVTKAVGVPELTAYLQGIIPLSEAIVRAQQATRHYAKRQTTWLRNQFDSPAPFSPATAPQTAATPE